MPTGGGADRRWRELEELVVGSATARAEVEVEGVNVEEGNHDALPHPSSCGMLSTPRRDGCLPTAPFAAAAARVHAG